MTHNSYQGEQNGREEQGEKEPEVESWSGSVTWEIHPSPHDTIYYFLRLIRCQIPKPREGCSVKGSASRDQEISASTELGMSHIHMHSSLIKIMSGSSAGAFHLTVRTHGRTGEDGIISSTLQTAKLRQWANMTCPKFILAEVRRYNPTGQSSFSPFYALGYTPRCPEQGTVH